MLAPGGRTISWVEHGPQDGIPVVYCHGGPGAPAEVAQFHGPALVQQLGIRLIVVARPGMWRSDHQPGRAIVDWAVDVRCVADACCVDRFAVVGYSAGAAYAALAAVALPDRVAAAALVAPVRHGDPAWSADLDRAPRWVERQALERPRATRAAMRAALATPLWRPVLRSLVRRTPLLERPDRLALRDREVRRSLERKAVQAFARGPAGPQHDMALMVGPWGFEPADVTVPTAIWQGCLDRIGATMAMAEDLHGRIRTSTLTIVEEGHLSTMTNHAAAIFATASAGW